MTRTTTRRANRVGAKPHLRVVPQPSSDGDLADLENQICELDRAARVAFLMAMHDLECPDEEGLGLFAVEQVERLASGLRESFYLSLNGKAVQS